MKSNKLLTRLIEAFSVLKKPADIQAFLEDLCTPQELEDLCLRWQVVQELKQGYTYREIHQRTKASLTTIGRIAKALNYGSGGYEFVFHHLQKNNK